MSSKTKKATFSLHETVLTALDEAVNQGAGPSKNAFVEKALLKEIKELNRQKRKAEWETAIKDPLFLKDLAEIETEFKPVDAEAARRMI